MTERYVASCKSCGAPIRWTKTSRGKNMPIDEKPSEGGDFAVLPDTDPPEVEWLSSRSKTTHPGPFFTSHFATCPNADQHRRKKSG